MAISPAGASGCQIRSSNLPSSTAFWHLCQSSPAMEPRTARIESSREESSVRVAGFKADQPAEGSAWLDYGVLLQSSIALGVNLRSRGSMSHHSTLHVHSPRRVDGGEVGEQRTGRPGSERDDGFVSGPEYPLGLGPWAGVAGDTLASRHPRSRLP
jgi:hypothetical protein